jgi:ectoine hydroxylase-related dioxygenase (phytanoyl-CoA dioxygenase family)
MRFFFLLLWSLALFATDFIMKPANGNSYPVTVFDPKVFHSEDVEGFIAFFKENGYVVVDHVSEDDDREALVQLIQRIARKEILKTRKRGFLELHHDNTLAKLRQNPKLYEVFSHLLGEEKLWVVFDRVIHHLPEEEAYMLNPHVDQNPMTHPDFAYLQGILALRDMDEFNGLLALVPQSHLFFSDYIPWIHPVDPFVIYQGKKTLVFIALRLEEGQIIIWDSRITHTRFCADHRMVRFGALLSFTPALQDPKLRELRLKYFSEGIGGIDHEAGLRATSAPRYEHSLREQPEMLTPLGRKLYGLDSWFCD